MKKLKTWELGRKTIEEFSESPKISLVIILDNIRSGHNVGAVFRTSDAFRIEQVCLCETTSTPPHPEIYKTALGAEDSLNWEKYENTVQCINTWKEKGYEVFGIEQTTNSIPLDTFEVEKNKKYAIVLGNEVEGVQLSALEACNGVIEIPQEGTKHSLNISVACGIVMWHFFQSLR